MPEIGHRVDIGLDRSVLRNLRIIFQVNALEGEDGCVGRIAKIPGDTVGIETGGIDDGPVGECSLDISSAQDRMGFKSFLVRTPVKKAYTGRGEVFFKSSGNRNGIDRGRIRRPEGDTRCSGIGFNLGEFFLIDDGDIDPVLISPFFELENKNSPICSGRRPSFIS